MLLDRQRAFREEVKLRQKFYSVSVNLVGKFCKILSKFSKPIRYEKLKVSTAHTHFTMFYYSVTVGYEKRSTKITVEREDTVTDVIIAACNALDVPFDANMNLQTKITGQWRYVHTHRLKEIVWSREGLRIWRSKTPLDVKIHNVMVYEGSWGAQPRNIQADAQYTVEKAVRVGGVEFNSQNITITDNKGAVAMSSLIRDYTALLLTRKG